MKKLFPITEPWVLEQYSLISKVLDEHKDVTAIAYQSNWNMVIACSSKDVGYVVLAEILKIWDQWHYEVRQGRKCVERTYIKIYFHRK